MHKANIVFWRNCKKAFPKFFTGPDVLEFGSRRHGESELHSVRLLIGDGPRSWTGIDWQDGVDVDVISLAHEFRHPACVKTVVSASMLEHDPYWDKSIKNMVSLLTGDGGLFLSWGAALNRPHCLGDSPVGGFHARKASDVLGLIDELGLHTQSFGYENAGAVNLIAFKDRLSIKEPVRLAQLHKADA